MRDTLASLLRELLAGAPPPKGTFAALRIRGLPSHLFGISETGAPCLLLDAFPSSTPPFPPLRLHGLEIHYSLPCTVAVPEGNPEVRTLTTVLCTTSSPTEREYFLHAAEMLLRIVGPNPNLAAIREAGERLAEIFQRLARPARTSVTGVLGELMLIARSASPRHAVTAWRCATDERFDFADRDVRIEVKATQEKLRAHYLTYEQCDPPAGTSGILASVFIEAAGGGTSLRELVSLIEASLVGHHSAMLRLHEVLADTLGDTLLAAMEERFDMQLAEESLQFYDLREIPAVRGALPRGVSHLRFRADLSGCRTMPAHVLAEASEVARRLLPT